MWLSNHLFIHLAWFLLAALTNVLALRKTASHCSVPHIANSDMEIFDEFHIKVICNTGYRLDGSPALTCNNGLWEPRILPSCVSKGSGSLCPILAYKHATVHMDGSEMKADIECHKGYTVKLNGLTLSHIKVICGLDREWVTTDGEKYTSECTSDAICPDPPTFLHTTKILPAWRPYREGSEVTYKCSLGYMTYVSYSNTVHLRCENGKWTGTPPNCEKVCNKPDNINGGHWEVLQTPGRISSVGFYPVATRIQYSCAVGLVLLGPEIIECESTYFWSDTAPICVKTESQEKCAVPDLPNGKCDCLSNGKYCHDLLVDHRVQCSCNRDDGYQLIGESHLRCIGEGQFNTDIPTCVKMKGLQVTDKSTTNDNGHMNTLAIVIATACSVLGVLLLVMVVMVFRRRKPRTRLYHQIGAPPYSRVHSNVLDEHDRVTLIGYDAARLPSYEEAVRTRGFVASNRHPSRDQVDDRGPVSEYRPLPNIPSNLRSTSESSNRHSIGTVSTVNRDGISEVFGSIDTVNVSMSDASTSVTVDTMDSGDSRPSNASGRATAGSLDSSRENLSNEDAPLLVNRTEEETVSEDVEICIEEEHKDA